jgi:hypothetical protein
MISLTLALLAGCTGDLVAMEYLAVINIAPPHGAINIGTETSLTATFSAPLQVDSLTDGAWLETATGEIVPTIMSYDDTSWTLSLRPEAPLADDSSYILVLSDLLESDEVGPLVAPLRSTFITAAAAAAGDEPPEAQVTVFSMVATCQPAVFDGRESLDPEGAALSYIWHIVGGPSGELVDADEGRTELWADAPGEFLLRLVVSDGRNLSDAAYHQITCEG